MSSSLARAMRSGRRVGMAVCCAVEPLESRLLLSAVSWTGAGDGVNWTDTKNWSTNALPGTADTVTINAAGSPTITIASGSQSVNSLTSSDPIKIASGAALAVTTTIGGTGTLTNAGTLTLKGTTVNVPLVNQGTVVVTSTGNTIAGAFTASAGSTLKLDDNTNYAFVTISSSFTNDGTIALSTESSAGYSVTLTMPAGATLTNASDGTITASGTGTDAMTITGALSNQGMLNLQHALTLNTGAGASSNSGTINASAGDLTLSQGSTGVFTNTGALTVATGHSLNVSGGALSLNAGGTLGGAGALNFSNATLNLGISLSDANNALSVLNTTINGPGTLTNAPGQTLTLNNTKINAPLVNQGTVVVTSSGNTITGAFTASSGSMLSMADSANNYAALTVSSGFTNDGSITMSAVSNVGYTVTLTVSSGTLTNAADGTITASGTGTDAMTITGALSNQGMLNLQHALTLNTGAGASSNSGTINASAGDLTLSQGSTGVFTNTGTLTVAAGHSLNASGGTLDLNVGGTFGGAGTINFSAITVNLGASLSNGTTTLNIPGTTINGPGTLTNASGKTLTLNNTKINAPLINQGTMVVTNTANTITGPFTAAAGSMVSMDDNNNYVGLTISSSFTNDGTIAMSTESSSGYNVTLTMSSGATLTNAADGTITASGTGADQLFISGAVTNKGTLNVQHALTVNNASDTFDATSGTLSIAAGRTLKINTGAVALGSTALSGTGTLDASNDVLALAGNQTLTAAGVQVILTNATVNGPGTLTNAPGNTVTLNNTKFNASLVNQGTMVVTNSGNTITGPFTGSAGSTLSLDDNNNYALVTVSSSFTNDGTIAMSTESSSGYSVTLTMSPGATLTNAADGTITASGTGADALAITGSVTNKGTLSVQHALTVNNASDTFDATSGTLSIAAGKTLAINGGALTLGSTALSGTGTLNVTNDTVALAGNQTLTAAGVQVTLTNTTVNGPGTLTNASGNTVTLNNTKVNASLVNQGTMVVTNSGNTITGPFTGSAGSTVSLDDNNNYAFLTVSSSFTNDGTIALSTESSSGYSVTLTMSLGATLTNAADGTITASGNGADALTITGSVTNKGTLSVQHALTVNNASDTFDATSGTLSIAAGKTLTINGGALTLGSTALSGTGTLNVSGDTVALAGNQTLTAAGVQVIFTNATVNGPGILTNAGTLTLNNTKVNAALVNQGMVVVTNTGNTITGPFTASAGSTLSLDDNNNYAILTVSSSFTNDGTIALSTESSSGYSVTLTVSSGSTLTNAADGTITATGNGADLLTLNGALSNQGTLSVQLVKLTVQNPTNLASNVLTNGTWQVSGGGKLILPSAITTNAANIAISGPASIITNSSGTTSALSGLTANGHSGSLTLTGGQALAVTPAGGTFTNDGTLNVGTGSELSVAGAFVQDSDGTLSVQIGGATSANFGQVVAGGMVTAGGTLQGSFANSYDPNATQTFAVFNGATESGTFAGSIGGVTPSGRTLRAHYNATSALIAIAPLAPSVPSLTAASDSGISQTDGITNVTTPIFTGTASDAGTVQLYSDGALVGTATVRAGGGAWSIQSSALLDGHHLITATVLDTDGDLGPLSTGPTILIDTVAPTIHATINAPAASGWYNIASGAADVHYVASDNVGGSGLASSVPADHVFADGANQSLAGVTIADVAGNTSTSESFSGIKQDTVAPTIHGTINAPASSGWYNLASGPADVHYVASDNTGGSGLSSSVPADHVFSDGSNQSLAAVTISDVAGNTATSESFTGIKQDTVAPTIHGTINSPASSGWYNVASGPALVHYVASDNTGGSGLASSVPADHLFSDGTNQSLAAVTISDVAGNTGTSESFSGIKQDTVAPTSAVGALLARETGPFTLNWSGQDNVGGSGVAGYSVYVSDNGGAYAAVVLNTTSTSTVFTGQAGHIYAFYSVASDLAGNVQPTPTAAQATTTVVAPTTSILATQSPNPSNATQSLTFTATVSGGVPNGETVTLEDATHSNAVVASGSLSNGSATLTVPAGALLAGTHNLIVVYGGDATFAASQSAPLAQTVQVVVTGVTVNGNLPALAGVQRSMVNSIVYTFSEAVNLAATNALSIAVHAGQSGTAPTLNYAALNPNADGSSTQWVVSFSGAGVSGGSIADGVYDISLNAAAATSDANPLVNSQVRPTDTFYRMFGDAQGTAKVNSADYTAFLSTFGLKSTAPGYLAYFADDGTTKIDSADYNAFLGNFGKKLSGFTATI